MVPFPFGGAQLAALPSGALFWPARRALLLADLHLEKASWYALTSRQFLPPYDSAATLAAVADAVRQTDARELWCLGDSFHDARGCERLAPADQASLRALTGAVRWTWITGNHDAGHDAGLAGQCGGSVVDEAVVDGLVLRHEADPAEGRPELSGHYHPKLRLTLKGKRVARRCFVATGRKLVLPAFGALTGGLDADCAAIQAAVGRPAHALVAVRDRLLRFPLAA